MPASAPTSRSTRPRPRPGTKILSVNLLSYAYLAREALPALRRSGKGAIVNISSTHAFNPRGGMGQYDVAKAGIISMTKTLAFEEADRMVCASMRSAPA